MLYGCRKCRREGEKLFLKGDRCLGQKCAVSRRPYAPGISGQKGQSMRSRISDYARQLREKQKAKRYYNLSEKQFANYYKNASQKKGNTSELLWQLIEMRLDNAIRRSQIARSIAEAQQMISHGLVNVNGHKVNIPSKLLKVGDKIKVRLSEGQNPTKQNIPRWLSLDLKSQILTVAEVPGAEGVETPFDVHLVIEFYSK